MPIVQLNEQDAEHKCKMLIDMCRGMLDELEATGNAVLAYRVGALAALAGDLAMSTPAAREKLNNLMRLIDKVVYKGKEEA